MRGSRRGSSAGRTSSGIIPAHAGLTHGHAFCAAVSWDHPRACGAHSVPYLHISPATGSSPRMRGSQALPSNRAMELGIIPAHAGLTGNGLPHGNAARDHPRACGAHNNFFEGVDKKKGSSPRMRGSPILVDSSCS